MSREWVIRTLIGLGLSTVEAEVYFFLAQSGSMNRQEIEKTLSLRKQHVHRSLVSLQTKHIVLASSEYPARFSAVPLEKVLDSFMETKNEQAEALRASRQELIAKWRAMLKKNSDGQ